MRKAAMILCLCGLLALTGCGSSGSREKVPETDPSVDMDTGAFQSGDSFTVKEIKGDFVQSSQETEDSDVIYLTMGTSGNWEGLLRGELMEECAQNLYDWSQGKLVLKCYYDGMLGSDPELLKGVQDGTLSIINSVPSYQVDAVPQAALLDVPGLFTSVEEYNTFIDERYMDTLQGYYQAAGIRLLSSSAYTFRNMTCEHELRTIQDLRGLKMRTMQNRYQIAFWQSMGALVSPLDFNQVRVSVQQGLIQAQENPLGYMFSANLADVQNCIVLTRHVPMISNFLMNEEQFQALPEEYQEMLVRALNEMGRKLADEEAAEEAQMRQELEAQGYIFVEPGLDILNAMADGQQVVLDMLRKDLGDKTVDDFMAAVDGR